MQINGMIRQTSGSILITNHDFAEFRERMHALAELAGSVNHLAKLAGISQTGLRHYFSSGEPSRPHLIRLAEAVRVNIEWLVTGRGPMRDLPRATRAAIAQNYEQYLLRHDRDDSEDARGLRGGLQRGIRAAGAGGRADLGVRAEVLVCRAPGRIRRRRSAHSRTYI